MTPKASSRLALFICPWIAPILLAAAIGWAQAPAPTASSAGLYRIAGTVVNSITGEPIPRATVSFSDVETRRTVATSATGKDGHFALEGLPAGKYDFTAAKRGYLTASYDQHEAYSSAIVTGEGQDTENLTFRLAPGATLTFIVTGDGGDPVEKAQILLFKRVHDYGLGQRMVTAGQYATMDDGEVNVYNLQPGDYFVAVKAEPWFAMHGAKKNSNADAAGQPAVRRTNPALDVVYPITFYNGVRDENSATPLHLLPGSRERISIQLETVPALHLFVPVPAVSAAQTAEDGGDAPNQSSLQLLLFGIKLPGIGPESADEVKDGVEEYTGIAPGHYELQAGDPPRILALDATADRQLAANTGTPAASFHALLHSASGGDFTGDATLLFNGTDPAHPAAPLRTLCNQKECSLDALPPGTWELAMGSGEHFLPILSIGEHGRIRSGNRVTATDKPLDLVLTIADANARLNGFAKKDGKGQAGVMVVLVPRNPAAHSDLFRRDQSDSDGSFSLRDVAPGSYTVVAIEDGWELEWQRPEVLAPFLPKGIAVTVPELNPSQVSTPPLHLSSAVPVQQGVEKPVRAAETSRKALLGLH
jgi:hypothetical protein